MNPLGLICLAGVKRYKAEYNSFRVFVKPSGSDHLTWCDFIKNIRASAFGGGWIYSNVGYRRAYTLKLGAEKKISLSAASFCIAKRK